MLNAVSLFSCIGVAEYYLKEIGINVVLASDIDPQRCKTYEFLYPETHVICGDIRSKDTKKAIINYTNDYKIDILIATPPCQGMSTVGKNRSDKLLDDDNRNTLIFEVFDLIDKIQPNYILFENVPRLLKVKYEYNKIPNLTINEILQNRYGDKYDIKTNIFNAADYGVPQIRERVFLRLFKKGLVWEDPKPISNKITVREAIEHLPSLEAGEMSDLKNHWARKHPESQIKWMKHTPSGESAYNNPIYFPQKKNGDKIKGFRNCYKRIDWDKPAPTITMRNEIISSQENVHPGRLKNDGTWSDARVFTLRELLILMSLPPDIDLPTFVSDTSLRQFIGEGIPPLLMKKIMEGLLLPQKEFNGISMFSSGGIAETYLHNCGINIRLANELVKERADFYSHLYPTTEMVIGDIMNDHIFNSFLNKAKEINPEFLLATPPCQGMSSLGKKDYDEDERNYLIFAVLKVIDLLDLDIIIIENVPKFFKLYFPFQGEHLGIIEILQKKYAKKYQIDYGVYNAKDYGVPQSRPRAIIKLYKPKYRWDEPNQENEITLSQAIGHLPSLENGEISSIKYHYALKHSAMQVECMSHTLEGCSAMKNPIFYPKKADGKKVSGFHNTYKRMRWDAPCPARATNNGLISGHNNVHPGRILKNGLVSDARALSMLELLIVSSLPTDWNLPDDYKDSLVRTLIGEAIPPKLLYKILSTLKKI